MINTAEDEWDDDDAGDWGDKAEVIEVRARGTSQGSSVFVLCTLQDGNDKVEAKIPASVQQRVEDDLWELKLLAKYEAGAPGMPLGCPFCSRA